VNTFVPEIGIRQSTCLTDITAEARARCGRLWMPSIDHAVVAVQAARTERRRNVIGCGGWSWQFLAAPQLRSTTQSSAPHHLPKSLRTRSRSDHDQRILIRLSVRISKHEDQCGIYKGLLLIEVLLETLMYVRIICSDGRASLLLSLLRFLSVPPARSLSSPPSLPAALGVWSLPGASP